MAPMRQLYLLPAFVSLFLLFNYAPLFADPGDPDRYTPASPKSAWGEFRLEEAPKKDPWWMHVLLWAPNRVMDFIDIFRLDIGVGPSYGGVIRASKYAQAGYRQMNPLSVRMGLMGRKAPFMIERSNEFGIGPGYVNSKDRKVCPGEVGAGADLFLVGINGGICADEVLDFVAGIFFLDVTKDDLH